MSEKQSSATTESYWLQSPRPAFAPLNTDVSTDLCVIGAGIAGLTTAYLAAKSGRRVLVLDEGEIASGESGRTTAHLVSALDDRYFELERLHGRHGAQLAAHSHRAAIDQIEAIARRENIECGFERVNGYLFVPENQSSELLERELAAAHRAGLRDVRLVPTTKGIANAGPALLFPHQAQFHPMRYLAGLARAIERLGGRIFTDTHVSRVEDGAPATVTTARGHTVRAEAVVIATNTPSHDRVVLHTKQAPYRTYVVGLALPAGEITHELWWDTEDPYHYARIAGPLDAATECLIVGGEDHKTGQANDAERRLQSLEQWARRHFPATGAVRFRWSGQVMEPADGLAFIGRNPGEQHVFIVTGDSGNGMTHGTIAGILLNDLIAGIANPWADLYEPKRKTLRAAAELGRENANVSAQYADWLTRGEVRSVDEIAAGGGAIVRQGLHKLAVYRDRDGAVHSLNARCPHLDCIVHWNNLENSWDCPCHGSRFDAYGKLLNGPANSNLQPFDKRK